MVEQIKTTEQFGTFNSVIFAKLNSPYILLQVIQLFFVGSLIENRYFILPCVFLRKVAQMAFYTADLV